MSLDPLNVGILKTCGENLVIAFSRVFLLSTMNVTTFSVCKLALAASFQQIHRTLNPCTSHYKGKNISSFHGKTRKIYDLESPYVCFFYEEEAAKEDMFTRIMIIFKLLWPVTHSPRVAVYRSALLSYYIFFEVIVIDNIPILYWVGNTVLLYLFILRPF